MTKNTAFQADAEGTHHEARSGGEVLSRDEMAFKQDMEADAGKADDAAARDAAGLKALLDEHFSPNAVPPLMPDEDGAEPQVAEQKPVRKASSPRVWISRIVKSLIGIAVLLVVGVMPAQRLLQVSSVEAVVNAPLVTVRAPIDGIVGSSYGEVRAGQSVKAELPLVTISNPRAESTRLIGYVDRLDRLRAEQRANNARLAALEELRGDLQKRVSDFAQSRIAYVDARIEQTEARLTSAVVAVEDMVGKSKAADSSDLVAKSGDPHAVVAAAYARELRGELESLKVERVGLLKGIFVGDSYNDRPQSAQRLDEVETQIADLKGELGVAENQILWAEVDVRDERKRLAMESKTELAAPVSGEVWEVLVAPGEHVIAGEPLLNIVDCSSPVVTAVVSEAVYNTLIRGSPAAFQFREGGAPLKGRVVLLSGMATAAASYAITPAALTGDAYRVTVALDDADGRMATADGSKCALGRTGRVVFGRDAL